MTPGGDNRAPVPGAPVGGSRVRPGPSAPEPQGDGIAVGISCKAVDDRRVPREPWEVRERLLAVHERLPAEVCPRARGAVLGLVLRLADRPPPAADELARALRAVALIVTTTCPGSPPEVAHRLSRLAAELTTSGLR